MLPGLVFSDFGTSNVMLAFEMVWYPRRDSNP